MGARRLRSARAAVDFRGVAPPAADGTTLATADRAMTIRAEHLLGECRAAGSGLAAVVERVLREETPYAVVSAAGVEAWRTREPGLWRKVAAWLDERGVTLVQV